MSGHSKWATIKHKKGAVDAKRGKLFTKLIKELTVAARMGGGEPDNNPRLRTAIKDAKGQSMPGDTIKNAIKRGTGEMEGAAYEDVLYEGTGPGGTLFLVEGQTDNRNRTVAEIRKIFEKKNGNLGGAGVAAWGFDRKGLITLEKNAATEDQLMEVAVGAGAEDYVDDGELWSLTTPPESLSVVLDSLENAKIAVKASQLGYIPKNKKTVTGHDASVLLDLVEALDDHDDVANVYADFDVSDEELAKDLVTVVLGLDPGTRHFGWGVVRKVGTRLIHVAHGVLDVEKKGELGARLVAIEAALVEVVREHSPVEASIESLFFAKDAQAAAKLGHARGVALLVCVRAGLPSFEYAPTRVKRTVTGAGRAEKSQVAQMIKVVLGLAEIPRPDAADALAIAVTHLQGRSFAALALR